jgi:virginiamycin B lyase
MVISMKLPKRKSLVMGVTFILITVFTLVTPVNASPSYLTGIKGFKEYDVPGGVPWGTALDKSGRLWVAIPGCNLAPTCPLSTPPGKLALFDPKTQRWITVVALPEGYGQPTFVAVDQKGKVWFTMPVTNTIGRYDPVRKTIAQWVVPTRNAGPWGITVDSKGLIWFTEHYQNKIGSFNPSTKTFRELATPTPNSLPYGIAVDRQDNIWFTENPDTVALIGKYTHRGVFYEYKIRNIPTAGTGLTPHMITIDPRGNVWWSEGWVGGIGKLNVALAKPGTNRGVTEYLYRPSCKNCSSHTSGISADKRGQIWFDDGPQNTIGSLPIGGGSFTFNKTNGYPHDGLIIDAQNRIWFDELFANKLAAAIPAS